MHAEALLGRRDDVEMVEAIPIGNILRRRFGGETKRRVPNTSRQMS